VNGFSERGTSILDGHSITISKAIALIDHPTKELEHRLAEIRHLVVDEAQDLVGERGKFVLSLVKALPEGSGATILGDEAQAIYDFADDRNPGTPPEQTVLQHLERIWSATAQRFELATVYRTESATLRSLFVESRRHLRVKPAAEGYASIRNDIIRLADERADTVDQTSLGVDDLVLHRSRFNALRHFSYYAPARHDGRLRISGFPRAIHPWVAGVMSRLTTDRISRAAFEEAWIASGLDITSESCTMEAAWQALTELSTGRTHPRFVNRAEVRETLAAGIIPDAMLLSEYGFSGPIFSTIHASKGREAGTVRVFLPYPSASHDVDWSEEARILFVAATRTRKRLIVYQDRESRMPGSGVRDFVLLRGKRMQFEVGREGDLDPASPIALPDAFAHDVDIAQKVLWDFRYQRITLRATYVRGRYALQETANNVSLGSLDERFGRNLMTMAATRRQKTPSRLPGTIYHLHSLGSRSVIMSEQDLRLTEAVSRPYARRGFWLAPMVVGIGMVYLKPRNE
jgi:hypothetical protein